MRLDLPTMLEEGTSVPSYQSSGSAGADVRARLKDGPLTLHAHRSALVPTGLRVQIPSGYELQVAHAPAWR